MSDERQPPPANVPRELYESMMLLRRDAAQAPSLDAWRRTGRWASPEEIALSERLRKPHHCTGHSSRTGLNCARNKVHGLDVCRSHGGSLERSRRRAAQRLAAMVDPALGNMEYIAGQKDNLSAA